MRKTRILVVDDELVNIKLLRARLEPRGYEVLAAMDGTEAIRIVETELPDLLILDIIMPKMDGFEVCRRLREWSQIPIIMLSSLDDPNDKVKCLDLGADDYIPKPFDANELLSRINAVLRRTGTAIATPSKPSFACDAFKINFAQREVSATGKEIKLTPTEYNLLQEFVLNAEKVLTHTHLLNKVWGVEYREEREYLHVFVRRQRAKLEPDPANPEYFVTVSGIGYQFKNIT